MHFGVGYGLPSQVICLKTEFEKCQVALCGIFSTTVKKDAKRHQWRHIQGEVNTLHKLDKHYYGMFGFLLMNEKISANLSNNFCIYERIRVALQWVKKNNHLYSQSQEKTNISACVNGIPYINGAREMGVYERIASVT